MLKRMLNKSTKKGLEGQLEKDGMKKITSLQIAKLAEKHVPEKTHERMKRCMCWKIRAFDKELMKTRVMYAESCNNRACPNCAYMYARRDAKQLAMMMRYIEDVEKKVFILVTFTAPNVKAPDLDDEITRQINAFKKMMEPGKELDAVIKGYARKLEVTYDAEPKITRDMWFGNKEKKIKPRKEYYKRKGLKLHDPNPNYDTYHTHIHAIFAVNKNYFTKGYIKQEKWLDLWRKYMKDPRITQVDVRRVGDAKKGSAVAELAKYTAKHSEMVTSQEVFDTFYTALHRRRLLTFGGLFKKACALYKEYKKLKGEEKKKHVMYKYDDQDTTEYVYRILQEWGYKEQKYIVKDKRELTAEEKARLSGSSQSSVGEYEQVQLE